MPSGTLAIFSSASIRFRSVFDTWSIVRIDVENASEVKRYSANNDLWPISQNYAVASDFDRFSGLHSFASKLQRT